MDGYISLEKEIIILSDKNSFLDKNILRDCKKIFVLSDVFLPEYPI